jgi:hypothetical protein
MDQTRDSSQFEAALGVTDRRYNTMLFIGLGFMLVASFLYEGSGFKRPVFDYSAIGIVLALLLWLVVSLAKKKNRIARAFGLECQHCKHLPLAISAVDAYRSGHCAKCGATYSPDAAQQRAAGDVRNART